MNGLKQLAIKAGMYYRETEDEFCKADTDGIPMEMLETFAQLVALQARKELANELAGIGEWPSVRFIEDFDS